jgi:hypothetical protein
MIGAMVFAFIFMIGSLINALDDHYDNRGGLTVSLLMIGILFFAFAVHLS